MSIHPMVTRSRVRSTRPNPYYAGHVSTISPLPRSYKEAFNDPNLQNAMFNEYNAIIKNKTWTSVPRPEGANIVRCVRLFRHKFLANGTLSRYKARLVANGSTQRKYAIEILKHAHMVGCHSSRTHVDTESKLGNGGTLVCLYMHDLREPHFSALKRILRYAGCPTTRRSTSGYCVFLGNNLLSWSFKRQSMLSRSSVEAEYHGVANAVAETCWIQNLLRELHTPLSSTTIMYCDNYADIFTKGLPSALFDVFHDSLSVCCTPAPTAGKY
nr:hypothetical protein [Tanacetum cinerariifolium]